MISRLPLSSPSPVANDPPSISGAGAAAAPSVAVSDNTIISNPVPYATFRTHPSIDYDHTDQCPVTNT